MKDFNKIPSDAVVEQTATALRGRGYEVVVVDTAAQAKDQALSWIPQGSEVLTVSSVTVDAIGLGAELNDSGRYDSIKKKTYAMDRATQAREIRKLSASPDFVVGSVHALTQDGVALIATMTGSQLAAYTFGAGTVVWVVGANKIVADLTTAHERVEGPVLDLESKRAAKAYGLPDTFRSFVGKLLTFNREANPARVKIVLVKEVLGQ